MWTDSQTGALTDRLDRLTPAETLSWLRDALHGRQPLPLLSPDETSYLGVLRLEPLLSKETRRDLASACHRLVYDFIHAGQADPEFLNSLLRLAVHFELDELATPLATLAEDFPQRLALPIPARKLVLATLVDLKIPQPQEFWFAILEQDNKAYGALVVSGLLAVRPSAAILALPSLPDDQTVADAVAIVLEQTAHQLPPRDRAELIAHVQDVLPRCCSRLRASIKEWLAEIDAIQHSGKTKMNASIVEPTFRNLDALRAGLKKFDPSLKLRPASARLCA